ncbi:MAG: hypothetical protein LAT68_06660 [Cyclobacteriaceae bacterium]|nr:outer membrane beta-barrel protein [Cyclobacteriaceae bacterium]MCH8515993.1 hypothetical protein [Cyclobacteriaceae bacterium]
MNSILLRCFLFALLLGIASSYSFGQSFDRKKRKPKSRANEFLNTQWWIGIYGGANVSDADLILSHSLFTPMQSGLHREKEYQSFADIGSEVGIDIAYYYSFLSINFRPGFHRNRLSFTNESSYSDLAGDAGSIEMNFLQTYTFERIHLPLSLRLERQTSEFRPYIGGGIFFDYFTNTNMDVVVSGTDGLSGADRELETQRLNMNATNQFRRWHFGWTGSIGANYHINNFRLNFDISYRSTFGDVSSTKYRYDTQLISGSADVADEFRLQNIAIQMGIQLPLKFLDRSYQTIN